MNKYSITITGIIVMVVGTLLMDYGFTESCTNEMTSRIPLLLGGILAWYGRKTATGTINIAGFRT